ncbi:hypothetical protein CEXT_655481, partial [Caerostris extrusa]
MTRKLACDPNGTKM